MLHYTTTEVCRQFVSSRLLVSSRLSSPLSTVSSLSLLVLVSFFSRPRGPVSSRLLLSPVLLVDLRLLLPPREKADHVIRARPARVVKRDPPRLVRGEGRDARLQEELDHGHGPAGISLRPARLGVVEGVAHPVQRRVAVLNVERREGEDGRERVHGGWEGREGRGRGG